jgi:putative hydrolase of the HAD superfamily
VVRPRLVGRSSFAPHSERPFVGHEQVDMSAAVRNRAAPNTNGDAPMTRDTTDALLVALGNVVFDLDFNLAVARWAAHAACDEALIRERFRMDDAYRRQERGEIDDAYSTGVRAMLGIDNSNAQLLDGWNGIYIGEMPGMANLLARAAQNFPLYAFSNTIAHIGSTGQYALPRSSPRDIYASSTIGLRKPDAEAFAHVAAAIGMPAERLVCFDDIYENIEGARACGLVHVTSVADVVNALAALAR